MYLVASLNASVAHTAKTKSIYKTVYFAWIVSINVPAITALVDATAGIMCFTTPELG